MMEKECFERLARLEERVNSIYTILENELKHIKKDMKELNRKFFYLLNELKKLKKFILLVILLSVVAVTQNPTAFKILLNSSLVTSL